MGPTRLTAQTHLTGRESTGRGGGLTVTSKPLFTNANRQRVQSRAESAALHTQHTHTSHSHASQHSWRTRSSLTSLSLQVQSAIHTARVPPRGHSGMTSKSKSDWALPAPSRLFCTVQAQPIGVQICPEARADNRPDFDCHQTT